MKALTEKIQGGIDLKPSEVGYAVTVLLSDQIDDLTKAAFLTALHTKGETADEITAFVQHLMERAVDPSLDPKQLPGPMIDVCGTGGDGLDLFNVSTTIMFILAAGGAAVVKHGNRSVTSLCGSADVLEALGVPIDLEPEDLRECLERHGLCFIYARQYHPAFRAIAGMRKRLAGANKRTVFNLIGPLLNPARPSRQLLGVYAPRLTTIFAEVLKRLGRERAWVVHGSTDTGGGMDDISICGPTTLADLENGKITTGVIDPRWFGIAESSCAELRGDHAAANAACLEGILTGEVKGPRRDLALVNAAGGFVVAGLAANIPEGVTMARAQLESGRALEKLRALQGYTRKSSR
ncbi:MAG: anthranilate phosphoribosyltransferase [Chthoniobacterales bacterium]|nr:anthranilate phosphoribosyltransferase [Chthoniobacterales bacterium]